MKPKGVSMAELEAIQNKEKNGPRFSAEDERRHALKLLAKLAGLSQAQRTRVLRRAMTINQV